MFAVQIPCLRSSAMFTSIQHPVRRLTNVVVRRLFTILSYTFFFFPPKFAGLFVLCDSCVVVRDRARGGEIRFELNVCVLRLFTCFLHHRCCVFSSNPRPNNNYTYIFAVPSACFLAFPVSFWLFDFGRIQGWISNRPRNVFFLFWYRLLQTFKCHWSVSYVKEIPG